MASRRISILDNFLSGGKVGNNCLSVPKAELKASTRILSRVACAVRYLIEARRLRRFSSRVNLRSSVVTLHIECFSWDHLQKKFEKI